MCLNCGTPAQNNADDKRLHLYFQGGMLVQRTSLKALKCKISSNLHVVKTCRLKYIHTLT